jgi:ribonuclease P protein component
MPAQTGSIGFVITKKTSKSAVIRNRSKRRIRAVVQDLLKQKYPTLLGKYSMAIVIHRTLDHLSPADLQTEVTGVFEKVPA